MDIIKQRKDLEYLLITKAMEDKKFEELLLANPSQALKDIGFPLPENCNLKIIKENKGEITVVIPSTMDKDELSELELISTSGGSVLAAIDNKLNKK